MADMLASLEDLASLLGRDANNPINNASGTLALEISTAVVQSAADGQRIVQVVADTAVAYAEAEAALEARPSLKAAIQKQYGPRARMVRIL
jgi:hypothetical protein